MRWLAAALLLLALAGSSKAEQIELGPPLPDPGHITLDKP